MLILRYWRELSIVILGSVVYFLYKRPTPEPQVREIIKEVEVVKEVQVVKTVTKIVTKDGTETVIIKEENVIKDVLVIKEETKPQVAKLTKWSLGVSYDLKRDIDLYTPTIEVGRRVGNSPIFAVGAFRIEDNTVSLGVKWEF